MNMNRFLLSVLLLMVYCVTSAQEFVTHGATPDLHLLHKVAAKETWYSISKLYNLSPNELASFNKQGIDKPLEIGQSVKVPLTKANFSQADPTGSVDDLIPVYHIVQEKEWMYRISVNHNKVPIEKLERWNSITRDQVKAGKRLIVGFLLAKDALATVRNNANEKASTAKTTSSSTTSSTPPPSPVIPKTTTQGSTAKVDGGYFKNMYDENGRNQTAVAGIFKSTSGWNDGKYYALMNNVTVGPIVKVNFAPTNKSIYAKVLGELPDMKESAGLSMRISDAAAKELGAVNNKFNVEVKY